VVADESQSPSASAQKLYGEELSDLLGLDFVVGYIVYNNTEMWSWGVIEPLKERKSSFETFVNEKHPKGPKSEDDAREILQDHVAGELKDAGHSDVITVTANDKRADEVVRGQFIVTNNMKVFRDESTPRMHLRTFVGDKDHPCLPDCGVLLNGQPIIAFEILSAGKWEAEFTKVARFVVDAFRNGRNRDRNFKKACGFLLPSSNEKNCKAFYLWASMSADLRIQLHMEVVEDVGSFNTKLRLAVQEIKFVYPVDPNAYFIQLDEGEMKKVAAAMEPHFSPIFGDNLENLQFQYQQIASGFSILIGVSVQLQTEVAKDPSKNNKGRWIRLSCLW